MNLNLFLQRTADFVPDHSSYNVEKRSLRNVKNDDAKQKLPLFTRKEVIRDK